MTSVRRGLWMLGAPARWVLLGAIWLYQHTLTGVMGGECRFSPTCSHYAAEAIRERGASVGAALSIWRILRCNPFGKGGLDPVPPRPYDRNIPRVPFRGADHGSEGVAGAR